MNPENIDADHDCFAVPNLVCTLCEHDMNHFVYLICPHPVLEKVPICAVCMHDIAQNRQLADTAEEDQKENYRRHIENRSDYCSWCGDGGDLFLCSNESDCNRGFCVDCLTRNLGEEYVKQVEEAEEWQCLCCNPEPLNDFEVAMKYGQSMSLYSRLDNEDGGITMMQWEIDVPTTSELCGTTATGNSTPNASPPPTQDEATIHARLPILSALLDGSNEAVEKLEEKTLRVLEAKIRDELLQTSADKAMGVHSAAMQELQTYRTYWQKHLDICQQQEMLLLEELEAVGFDPLQFDGYTRDEYMKEQTENNVESTAYLSAEKAMEKRDADELQQRQSTGRGGGSGTESNIDQEFTWEEETVDEDTHNLLGEYTKLAATDEIVQGYQDPSLHEPLAPQRYPPSFANVTPQPVLHAFYHCSGKERKVLKEKYGIPAHIVHILSILANNSAHSVPKSTEKWSFSRRVHPAVRFALYYSENRMQQAVICARYNLDASICTVTDFGDARTLYKNYSKRASTSTRQPHISAAAAAADADATTCATNVASAETVTGFGSENKPKYSYGIYKQAVEEEDDLNESMQKEYLNSPLPPVATAAASNQSSHSTAVRQIQLQERQAQQRKVKQLMMLTLQEDEEEDQVLLQRESRRWIQQSSRRRVPLTAAQKELRRTARENKKQRHTEKRLDGISSSAVGHANETAVSTATGANIHQEEDEEEDDDDSDSEVESVDKGKTAMEFKSLTAADAEGEGRIETADIVAPHATSSKPNISEGNNNEHDEVNSDDCGGYGNMEIDGSDVDDPIHNVDKEEKEKEKEEQQKEQVEEQEEEQEEERKMEQGEDQVICDGEDNDGDGGDDGDDGDMLVDTPPSSPKTGITSTNRKNNTTTHATSSTASKKQQELKTQSSATTATTATTAASGAVATTRPAAEDTEVIDLCSSSDEDEYNDKDDSIEFEIEDVEEVEDVLKKRVGEGQKEEEGENINQSNSNSNSGAVGASSASSSSSTSGPTKPLFEPKLPKQQSDGKNTSKSHKKNSEGGDSGKTSVRDFVKKFSRESNSHSSKEKVKNNSTSASSSSSSSSLRVGGINLLDDHSDADQAAVVTGGKRKGRQSISLCEEDDDWESFSDDGDGGIRPSTSKKRLRQGNLGMSKTSRESGNWLSKRGRFSAGGLLFGDAQLSKETRQVMSADKLQRREQKLYTYFKDDAGLTLNPKRPTEDPAVMVIDAFNTCLKDHQKEGLRFIWDNVMVSVTKAVQDKSSGGGCILAHCMGLGKTLTVIAFVATLLTNPVITKAIDPYQPPSADVVSKNQNSTTSATAGAVTGAGTGAMSSTTTTATTASEGACNSSQGEAMDVANKPAELSNPPTSPSPAPAPKKPLIKTILVVAPVNTLENWRTEIHRWTPEGLHSHTNVQIIMARVQGSKEKQNAMDRLRILRNWHHNGGILIIGYDMMRYMTSLPDEGPAGSSKKRPGRPPRQQQQQRPQVAATNHNSTGSSNSVTIRTTADSTAVSEALFKEQITEQRKLLLSPGPDIVVADEAHIIKERTSGISQTMSHIRTKRRIALTGSPLQNNLQEYWCMVNWVKPLFLGNPKEFRKRFIKPIKEGESKNAHPHQIKRMKERAYILHKQLRPIVQRKDMTELAKTLPPKREFVITVKMTNFQKFLYARFLNFIQDTRELPNTSSPMLICFHALQRVWNHPCCVVTNHHKKLLKDAKNQSKTSPTIGLGIAAGQSTIATIPASITQSSSSSSGGAVTTTPRFPAAASTKFPPACSVKYIREAFDETYRYFQSKDKKLLADIEAAASGIESAFLKRANEAAEAAAAHAVTAAETHIDTAALDLEAEAEALELTTAAEKEKEEEEEGEKKKNNTNNKRGRRGRKRRAESEEEEEEEEEEDLLDDDDSLNDFIVDDDEEEDIEDSDDQESSYDNDDDDDDDDDDKDSLNASKANGSSRRANRILFRGGADDAVEQNPAEEEDSLEDSSNNDGPESESKTKTARGAANKRKHREDSSGGRKRNSRSSGVTSTSAKKKRRLVKRKTTHHQQQQQEEQGGAEKGSEKEEEEEEEAAAGNSRKDDVCIDEEVVEEVKAGEEEEEGKVARESVAKGEPEINADGAGAGACVGDEAKAADGGVGVPVILASDAKAVDSVGERPREIVSCHTNAAATTAAAATVAAAPASGTGTGTGTGTISDSIVADVAATGPSPVSSDRAATSTPVYNGDVANAAADDDDDAFDDESDGLHCQQEQEQEQTPPPLGLPELAPISEEQLAKQVDSAVPTDWWRVTSSVPTSPRGDANEQEDDLANNTTSAASKGTFQPITSLVSSGGKSDTQQQPPILSSLDLLRLSNKMVALLSLLALSVEAQDKMLVFSQNLATLDAIEMFLQMHDWGRLVDRVYEQRGPNSTYSRPKLSKWANKHDYLRIDGAISAGRQKLIDQFNKGKKYHLMLISTKAGNMGINLQAANRVVIFDTSWNPVHDLQAIYRAYRYGQTKPVFVYRLLAADSMEQKIYKLQVVKQQLSARVVDAQMPDNQFTDTEHKQMMTFQDTDALSSDDDEDEDANELAGGGNQGEEEEEEEEREKRLLAKAERKQARVSAKKAQNEAAAAAALLKVKEVLDQGTQDPVLNQFVEHFAVDMLKSIENQELVLEDKEEEHLNEEEQRVAEENYNKEINPGMYQTQPTQPEAGASNATNDANKTFEAARLLTRGNAYLARRVYSNAVALGISLTASLAMLIERDPDVKSFFTNLERRDASSSNSNTSSNTAAAGGGGGGVVVGGAGGGVVAAGAETDKTAPLAPSTSTTTTSTSATTVAGGILQSAYNLLNPILGLTPLSPLVGAAQDNYNTSSSGHDTSTTTATNDSSSVVNGPPSTGSGSALSSALSHLLPPPAVLAKDDKDAYQRIELLDTGLLILAQTVLDDPEFTHTAAWFTDPTYTAAISVFPPMQTIEGRATRAAKQTPEQLKNRYNQVKQSGLLDKIIQKPRLQAAIQAFQEARKHPDVVAGTDLD